MIKYTLKCDNDHRFDSWFQSGAAFDKLAKAGMVTCAVCGSAKVDKALMSPGVSLGVSLEKPAPDAPAPQPTKPLTTPQTDAERAVADLRAKVEANSEYVGNTFAAEARAMHDGDAPARSIYGEAKPEEARKLVEDGVPLVPLPFMPQRKAN
jgi:hypothetical protein